MRRYTCPMLLVILAFNGCTPNSGPPPTSGARLEYVVSLEFALEKEPGHEDMLGAIETVVRRRVESITPAYIAAKPPNRIIVDLPNVSDADVEAVKSLLSRPGVLSLYLLEEEATEELIASVRAAGGETERYRLLSSLADTQKVHLARRGAGEIERAILDSAAPSTDETGAPALQFHMWTDRERLLKLTSENIGQSMAMAVDGVVIQRAIIETVIQGSGRITGSFTPSEIDHMVTILTTPFGVPPTLVLETKYGG